jgi:hypothetical protein
MTPYEARRTVCWIILRYPDDAVADCVVEVKSTWTREIGVHPGARHPETY